MYFFFSSDRKMSQIRETTQISFSEEERARAQQQLDGHYDWLKNLEDDEFKFIKILEFQCETHNYGFEDTDGQYWKVEFREDDADNAVVTGVFPGISPATNWIDCVCNMMEHDSTSNHGLINALCYQKYPQTIEEIPQMLERIDHYHKDTAQSAVEIFQEYENELLQQMAEQTLRDKLKFFQMNFDVIEVYTRVEGDQHREVWLLENGEEVDRENYLARVEEAFLNFIRPFMIEGFTDSRGNCWRVVEDTGDEDPEDTAVKLSITGRFHPQ